MIKAMSTGAWIAIGVAAAGVIAAVLMFSRRTNQMDLGGVSAEWIAHQRAGADDPHN
jgi:hypothetical protein